MSFNSIFASGPNSPAVSIASGTKCNFLSLASSVILYDVLYLKLQQQESLLNSFVFRCRNKHMPSLRSTEVHTILELGHCIAESSGDILASLIITMDPMKFSNKMFRMLQLHRRGKKYINYVTKENNFKISTILETTRGQ